MTIFYTSLCFLLTYSYFLICMPCNVCCLRMQTELWGITDCIWERMCVCACTACAYMINISLPPLHRFNIWFINFFFVAVCFSPYFSFIFYYSSAHIVKVKLIKLFKYYKKKKNVCVSYCIPIVGFINWWIKSSVALFVVCLPTARQLCWRTRVA